MNKAKLLFFILCFCFVSLGVSAQEYDVDYKNQTIEQVIKDLRKRTGYQFVYKKETLENVPLITCRYPKVTLEQLLDRIFYEEAGLDYEIANGTIILKKSSADRPYFKRLVVGIVTDVNDEPLPGATVRLKGTPIGVTSDLEGIFSLMVEGSRPVLEISYVGMKSQEVRLSSRTNKEMYVKLEADTKLLEDIIVTG